MAYTWPSREEWAAAAEYSVRTACYVHQRVSCRPEHWLTTGDLAEAADLVPLIHVATRRLLNRKARPLLAAFPTVPTGADYYEWFEALGPELQQLRQDFVRLRDHRVHLNAAMRTLTRGLPDVQGLAIAWSGITRAAQAVDAAPEQAQRLAAISSTMIRARDTAGQQALADAIARAVTTRNSDAGWEKELRRRASIDAGPKVTYHAL